MTFLLDVNVVIALLDPMHVQHDAAHGWFVKRGRRSWASCPLTQNGVLRIVGHPRYPNSPGAPATVLPLLGRLVAMDGHEFWADDVSLLDRQSVDPSRMLSSGQVTDSYLLALAKAHDGQLATFDRRMVVSAVRNAAATLHVIAA